MPRRKSAAYMSAGEQIAGTVLFVIYLLVLPIKGMHMHPFYYMFSNLLILSAVGG